MAGCFFPQDMTFDLWKWRVWYQGCVGSMTPGLAECLGSVWLAITSSLWIPQSGLWAGCLPMNYSMSLWHLHTKRLLSSDSNSPSSALKMRQHVSSKRWHLPASIHGAKIQNIVKRKINRAHERSQRCYISRTQMTSHSFSNELKLRYLSKASETHRRRSLLNEYSNKWSILQCAEKWERVQWGHTGGRAKGWLT